MRRKVQRIATTILTNLIAIETPAGFTAKTAGGNQKKSPQPLTPTAVRAIESMQPWAHRQREGDAVVWCTLEGFFWFPRTLMNFERLCLGLDRKSTRLNSSHRT